MGKLNTNQSMTLWESIGILQCNVKEFDRPYVFRKRLHISQNKRLCLHSYRGSIDQCSIKVQRAHKLFWRLWYFLLWTLEKSQIRAASPPMQGDAMEWHSCSPREEPGSTAPTHLLSRESHHTCPKLPTEPRDSPDPAAGHSYPGRTDSCFHKYKWATVAPGLLADGQFIVLPRKEADILFLKYRGSNRLHKGSLIYFLLYYELFSSTIALQMRKEGKEGHSGLLQQLNAGSSFPPVIHVQSMVRGFFWKARKQPPLITASHSWCQKFCKLQLLKIYPLFRSKDADLGFAS